MNIAILLTSNDTSGFARRFPNDGEKFITLLKPIRPDWTFKVYPVMDDVFPENPDHYDGFIITGSPASVHDGHAWIERLLALIRDLHAKRISLVGVCFGHQAIALALGGKVEQNPQGWVLGTETTRIDEPQPWMQPVANQITLYAAHKEQVTVLPEEAKTIGHATGCPNAAYIIADHIMTTEYHPEMTRDFMEELVDEMGGAISSEIGKKARQHYELGEEGALFGLWMANFLETGSAR